MTIPHRLFALVPLCLLLLPQRGYGAEVAAGRWTVVAGRVAVTKIGADAPRLAAVGDTIAVGDLLETGADARAQALLADQTVVNLSSGTSLRLLQYSWDAANNRRTAVVKLLAGKARFIVPAHKDSRFNVESAQAALATGAGDFVALAAPQETVVAVLEGSVRVKNVSTFLVEKVDVRANQTSAVKDKTAPSYPSALPPAERKAYRRDAQRF